MTNGIGTYSKTAASNTALFPEGMNPSAVNDNMRQVQADMRTWYETAEWVDYGVTPTQTSTTTFTMAADQTSVFIKGRAIRCTDSSTLYGFITGSSFASSTTTITVALLSGSLSGSLTAVALGICAPTNMSLPYGFMQKGTSMASATTVDLSTANGSFIDITGTTTITGLGTVPAGVPFWLRFNGALTFTHNATSLILPGGASITTASGDAAHVVSLGSGNWFCLSYRKADGTAIVASSGAPFSTATALVKDSSDATKLIQFVASGITTGNTRTITMPDSNVNLGNMPTATLTPINYIINGAMDFMQRIDPTVTTNSNANNTYGADRWKILTQTAAITCGRTTGDRAKNALRLVQSQVTAQRFGIIQHIENLVSYDLRSKTVYAQARIKSSSGNKVHMALVEWTGTADTPTTNVVNSWTNATYTTSNFFIATTTTVDVEANVTPTAATWTDLTATATVSASCNNLALIIWTDTAEAQNMTLDITQVGLYQASVAQTWQPEKITDELARCQRFYGKNYLIDVKPGTAPSTVGIMAATAPTNATTAWVLTVLFKAQMIAAPTVTVYDRGSTTGTWYDFTGASNTGLTATQSNIGTTSFLSASSKTSAQAGNVYGFNWTADADF